MIHHPLSHPLILPSVYSAADADLRTQIPSEEAEETHSNLTFVKQSISLIGTPSASVERNTILHSPSHVELTCNFSGDINSVRVIWKKEGEQINSSHIFINQTGNVLYTQYTLQILNSTQLGSYACVFEDAVERRGRGVFNFKVPEVHGKDKPLISYEGDSVVMICKSENSVPLTWIWFKVNETGQVPVETEMKEKYELASKYANETKLKILQLSEQDGGSYTCRAIFPLGGSEGKVDLKVLSYLVPLKPFLAIAAEVIILVTIILLYEMHTKRKQNTTEGEKEFEQIEQLKSEDSNGIENNTTRHRKI
ncbi:embigin isoform X2 [Ornithorhynchus anatinus]|uniref:Embigin n=1 Tax=Ornithorhynchus anatinus TaxID=9258 RepID=A0A6I8PHL6_ORNAN|nr:embigin isoform X2 [Ornithorhynchus anatinus]